MSERYFIPSLQTYRAEELIKRSKFITTIAHAANIDEAKLFIAEIKAEFPDATHNCWAYAVGPPGDTAQVGFSDDGEPHGTAGRPMLHALLHSNVGELAVVVSRYFGGIKLGAGGLVRAYSGAVANTLSALPVQEKIIPVKLRLQLEYNHITQLKRLFTKYEVKVDEEIFSQNAEYIISMPHEFFSAFNDQVVELTAGKALLEKVED